MAPPLDQLVCQKLCEADSGCVGVSWRQTGFPGDNFLETKDQIPACFLCPDDIFISGLPGFYRTYGFYRKPVGNIAVRSTTQCYKYVETLITNVYNLYINSSSTIFQSEIYVKGPLGSMTCPLAWHLVTDENECKASANIINMPFRASGCFQSAQPGCIYNQNALWFSNCPNTHAPNHGGICRTAQSKY